MRSMFHLLLAAMLVLPMAACANKGKLKSPSQIAAEEQKKEHKKAKAEQEKAKEQAADQPVSAQEAPLGAPRQGSD